MNVIHRKDYGLRRKEDGTQVYTELIGTEVNGETVATTIEVPEPSPMDDIAKVRAGELMAGLEALRQTISKRVGREVEIVHANDPAGYLFQWK